MSIAKDGEFFINQDWNALGIESLNIENCIKESWNGYRGVFGNPSFGFNERNLDFLKKLPRIKKIWFWDIDLNSIDGVYFQKELEEFGLFGKYPKIDFSKLPKLRELIWDYRKKDTGIEDLEYIELFHLWHCNPRSKSFKGVGIPKGVKELQIIWANPFDLEGLPRLEHLKILEFHRCRNLRSIEGIEKIAPNLERLVVDASKKLNNFSVLESHASLKEVWVNNKKLTRQSN